MSGTFQFSENNDDEDIVVHKRNKRVIVEDEDEVPNEVNLMEENVATVEVKVTVTKRYKYADTSFYKLIEAFYQKSSNKSVCISKDIKRNAFALLIKEYPDLTRLHGDRIITACASKCRDNINIRTEKKKMEILHRGNLLMIGII